MLLLSNILIFISPRNIFISFSEKENKKRERERERESFNAHYVRVSYFFYFWYIYIYRSFTNVYFFLVLSHFCASYLSLVKDLFLCYYMCCFSFSFLFLFCLGGIIFWSYSILRSELSWTERVTFNLFSFLFCFVFFSTFFLSFPIQYLSRFDSVWDHLQFFYRYYSILIERTLRKKKFLKRSF